MKLLWWDDIHGHAIPLAFAAVDSISLILSQHIIVSPASTSPSAAAVVFAKNLVTLAEKMTRDLVIVIGFRFLNSKREQIGIGLEELLKAKYVDCHQERICS
jgi:molybdopterin-guanine dinucleotide biosynthesis protein